MKEMSPKEMAQIATSKAKADLCNELERLEFIYERPVHIIDDELIESFVMLCIGNLIKLCSRYRKYHTGASNRKILIGGDRYYFAKVANGHLFSINDFESMILRWIPNDIDEILEAFSKELNNRFSLVEKVLTDYNTGRKAGEIAKATVDTLVKDQLKESGFKLRVICRNDGSWNCVLHSEIKEKSISFISDAMSITDDIKRILLREA
jgi:hypothetical protein